MAILFLTRIGSCSRKITRTVNAAESAVFLSTTSKNEVVLALRSGQTVNIGHKRMGKKLDKLIHGKRIHINYALEDGMVEDCLRMLIKAGPNNSLPILRENGMSICENPDLKTIRDLANFLSDRLRNQIFCVTGAAEPIRAAADNMQIKIFGLKAAILLGKYDKMAAILGDLNRLKNVTLTPALRDPAEAIQDIIDVLSFLAPPAEKNGMEKGASTLERMSAYLSERLHDIWSSLSIKNVPEIKSCLGKIDNTISDSQRKTTLADILRITIPELTGQIATLNKLLNENQALGKKALKLTDNLTELSVKCSEEALTEKLRDSIFDREDIASEAFEQEEALPQISKEMAGKVNLLIVDDEPGVRHLLRTAFENMGFKVTTAENGRQGLETSNKNHFDLILSDFSMPAMDGVDLINSLRQTGNNTPAFIVSGSPLETAPEKLSRLIKAGQAHFIPKYSSNMHKILWPAVRIALEKAGINIDYKRSSQPALQDKPEEKSEPLLDFKRMVRHKLVNVLAVPSGYAGMLLHDEQGDPKYKEHVEKVHEGIEYCRKTIQSLERFCREFIDRQRGDFGPLAELLKQENAETIKSINLLCKEETEYLKLPRITAAVAVLYTPVLNMISEQFKAFEQSKNQAALEKTLSLFKKLQNINDALLGHPENKEIELAIKTIDYIVEN